jgi:serine phosphatase RsbU (regulator of sigma subunit)
LRAGEAIVLYTDGLTDAYAPGRILEIDDLASLLASCAGRSAAEIADHILDAALNGHTAQPRDDIAVLVIRITTDGAARAAQGSATRTPAAVTGHGGT